MVWIQQSFKEPHCMGVELPVLVIHKLSRPNLWVYLGFSVCPLGCFVFGLDTISPFYSQIGFMMFKNFTDVKWRKGTEKFFKKRDFYKVIKFKTELFQCCCFYLSCSCPKVECSHGEKEVPLGSLSHQSPSPRFSSTLTPEPFPSWLLPRQKGILSRTRGSVA